MIKRLYKSVIPASRLHSTERTLRVKVLAGRLPLSAGRASRIPLVRKASDRSALRLLAKDHASILVPPPPARANSFACVRLLGPCFKTGWPDGSPSPPAALVGFPWSVKLRIGRRCAFLRRITPCSPRKGASPSLRLRVSHGPAARACVRLLGPCFKTGREGG